MWSGFAVLTMGSADAGGMADAREACGRTPGSWDGARASEPRCIGAWSGAISLVAALFRCSEPSRTPLRGSLRSALRPLLDCPAQLRFLAMNVAPGGDLRVKNIQLCSSVKLVRDLWSSFPYEDPAQDHNRALTLTTSVPGDPKFVLRGNVVDLAVAVVIGTARWRSGCPPSRCAGWAGGRPRPGWRRCGPCR
jgi:hypothetical protein